MNALDLANMITESKARRAAAEKLERKTGPNARTRAKQVAASMLKDDPSLSDAQLWEALDDAGFSSLSFTSIEGAVNAARKEIA